MTMQEGFLQTLIERTEADTLIWMPLGGDSEYGALPESELSFTLRREPAGLTVKMDDSIAVITDNITLLDKLLRAVGDQQLRMAEADRRTAEVARERFLEDALNRLQGGE